MNAYLEQLREHLQKELAKNAMDYLQNGLSLFNRNTLRGKQVVIGNLSIAIELMIKALIAKYHPVLLFKELPIEIKVLFICPEIETTGAHWRRFDIDIRSSTFKTIELDECISVFYVLFSKKKQLYQPYFRLLANCRNVSIHASMPSFQKYDLERTVYLALDVYQLIKDQGVFGVYSYSVTKADKAFLGSYDTERAERVRRKIEAAKKKSKEITHEECLLSIEGWEHFVTKCPVCNSDGVLEGYTEPWMDATSEYIEESGLTFSANSFKCDECGLVLDDVAELSLAGMDDTYDRSKDADKYFEEYEPDFEDIDIDSGR
jgi:hypothetical protein